MERMEVRAYAKINLALDVTGRREDGYHFVDMIMNQIDLWDSVILETGDPEMGDPKDDAERAKPARGQIALRISGADLSAGPDNLAWRAAEAMGAARRAKTGSAPPPVSIEVRKRIPVAAGLAGGSADAAAVLLGLNALWDLKLDLSELQEIGLRLGADVPFCLAGQAAAQPELGVTGGSLCARAEGIGEVLTPLPQPKLWVLLLKPSISVSTPEMYRSLDDMREYPRPDMERVVHGLKTGDLEKVFGNAGNVLESPAEFRYPVIKYTKSKINTKQHARYTAMSGSGPTVFGLFETEALCRAAADELASEEGISVFSVSLLIREG